VSQKKKFVISVSSCNCIIISR